MVYVRPDFLMENKKVCVNIPKETYVEFQKKLLDLNITIKLAFREFAQGVATGDPRAMKLLETIAQKIFRGELNKYHQRKNDPIDKLDQDVLYHLIEKDTNEKSDTDSDDD